MNHNMIVKDITRRLEKICNYVWSEEDYNLNGGRGESDNGGIDFYLRKKLYLVEDKKTDTDKARHKAYHQLDRAERFYRRLFNDFEPFDIVKFYAYSDKSKRRGYQVRRIK